MINIKELNIGNYLRVAKEGLCIKKGTIIKINGIDAENKFMEKGLVGAISCHPLDKYQFDGGIWLAYLEPIEITPEILEKNGWRVVAGNQTLSPWIAVWEKDDCSCVLFHNSKKAFITINNNIIDVTYVHQLQNILTLYGINKEIKL